MGQFEKAVQYIDASVRAVLLGLSPAIKSEITEIRLRLARPLSLYRAGQPFFLSAGGGLTKVPAADSLIITDAAIKNTFFSLCGYSVQSCRDQLRQGFFPLDGGNRAGIAGKAMLDRGEVLSVEDITSINFRIAAKAPSLDPIVRKLLEGKEGSLLIAGPPCSGKTTCLKGIIQLLADEKYQKVSVADERGELFWGTGGITADYLRFYPKDRAVDIAVRTLAPDVIICDEIGSQKDAEAVKRAFYSGVRVIAAAHGDSLNKLLYNQNLAFLMKCHVFDHIVFLSRTPVGKVVRLIRWEDIGNEIYRDCGTVLQPEPGGAYAFP